MSESQPEFPATLDLSSADTRGNYMENGWKDALVTEVTPIVTDNPDGKLPVGTPGINVMFRIDGGKYDQRPVWNRYWFPPAGYDEEKRNKSLGMFARFLLALGYPEDQVKTGTFQLNFTDMVSRQCKVNTKYNEDYDNNNVSGVKPREAVPQGSGAGVL
jgi:hypothetical protein